jgi:hypothetical protein
MNRSISENPEFNADWDVYRDEQGNAITITEDQLYAIWRAIGVVEDVREAEQYPSIWETPQVDIYKSRLLGRMLLDGKPPTRTKPPTEYGGPAWSRLPGGDPFASEIAVSGPSADGA